MRKSIKLDPNHLVQFLEKPASQFTKKDIIHYIEENDIKMLNFRYVAGDGRLKTLNFVINDLAHLERLLTVGERVDGSSLFKHLKVSSSDLYVLPRYKTAFLDPFSDIPTVDLLCYFFTSEGKPLESSPGYMVKKAHELLKKETGMRFQALGELEYYLFSEIDTIYPIIEQKGYHESHPFSKWGSIRKEAMKVISEIGGKVKYGHAEVGNIIDGNLEMVQHEIEFLPSDVEDAADQLVLAKWAVREIAYKYGMEVSFAPKIVLGQAGSGLHFHTRLLKDNKNMMIKDDHISDEAKKIIAGFLKLSKSLTAFGNTVPTSYLRLVPHQEAPTKICWGDRNRSVLVRVPLGWLGVDEMIYKTNPDEPHKETKFMNGQTVEYRSADGSANVHEILAGLTIAALNGLRDKDSLRIAEELYVKHDATNLDLDQLPSSCHESALCLEKDRKIYEDSGIFPPSIIDARIEELKSYNDDKLSEKLFGNEEKLKELVQEHLHCG